MNITGKTKDNVKARRDIIEICNRSTLEHTESGGKPYTPFCLEVNDRKEVLR
jgi:hypothetical protein